MSIMVYFSFDFIEPVGATLCKFSDMATAVAALKRSSPLLRPFLLPPAPSLRPFAASFNTIITYDSMRHGLLTTICPRPFSICPTPHMALTPTGFQLPPLMMTKRSSSSTSKSPSEGKSSSAESANEAKELRMASFREMMSSVATAPLIPMILGVTGAVPFLALTPPFPYLLPLPEAVSANPIEAQAFYGAAILSFLGGPHWGLAMVGIHASPNHKVFNFASNSLRYIWSVVPSLLAWAALLVPIIPKLQFLICSFGLALGVDIFFAGHGLTPPWYLPLRLLLSGIVILCLTASLIEVLLVQKLESRKQARIEDL